jgi:hypothetical protein
VGILTGLLTLPLAPVRGTIWIAERVAEQVAGELDDEANVTRQLAELEASYELGEIDREEYERREDELLERLAPDSEPSS